MKIAVISTMKGYSWGGSEELWLETVRAALGDNQQVMVSVFEATEVHEKIQSLIDGGVKVQFRKVQQYSPNLFKRAVNKIKNKVRDNLKEQFRPVFDFQPDIVYWSAANSYDSVNHPEVLQFLEQNKIPFAMICQGHEDLPFYWDEHRLTAKRCFQKAEWVGFVAQGLKNSAERHTAYSIDNGYVARNPVNLDGVDFLPYPSQTDVLNLAIVARLDARTKSHDVLLETLGKEQWRDRNWSLSLVGDGIAESYLKDLAEHYGISSKVKFLGHVKNIRQVWAEHHLFVLPSRYEGTPLALVEAMLCGRTAVVTNVGGTTEWITDGANGFVAEAATWQSLSKALERAWNERHNWEQMGAAARETALKLYDPKPGVTVLNRLKSSVNKTS